MTEVIREVETKRRGTGRGIATLALILAILALVLAWLAYNRAGRDLESQIRSEVQQQVESGSDEAQQGTDAVEETLDTGPDGVDDGAQ